VTTGSSVAYDYYQLVNARADTGLRIGAPRGLRRVRTGYAYQPPACCTHQRRRAACPGAPTHGGAPHTVLCVLATRAGLGSSRGCRTDLLRPVAPQVKDVPPSPPLPPWPSSPPPSPPLPPLPPPQQPDDRLSYGGLSYGVDEPPASPSPPSLPPPLPFERIRTGGRA
jgi:hypothetical protein